MKSCFFNRSSLATRVGLVIFASRCIDGDLETYCHGPQRHENPWLSITLADRRSVDRVEVYNRADCCYSRISPYEVWVGDAIGSAEGW